MIFRPGATYKGKWYKISFNKILTRLHPIMISVWVWLFWCHPDTESQTEANEEDRAAESLATVTSIHMMHVLHYYETLPVRSIDSIQELFPFLKCFRSIWQSMQRGMWVFCLKCNRRFPSLSSPSFLPRLNMLMKGTQFYASTVFYD